ncbi:cbb3-type cytochrome oxidase assembly protein CcoS [Kangiella shandongensis]|uniref:cbb3-type cytochrome oxidase assembly protein CcoS n=1 Tax=Kangiella shandongensis TaxID=2763258 RepID=UPI001CC1841C|nr:cbb3-type cytochrome oxidase assembly protein CcoS [Kangiella shandongensis]
MDAIYLLIPITVVLLIVAVAVFFWAVNSDQYSDLDKEAHRILFDKESPQKEQAESDNGTRADDDTESGG